MRKFFQWQKKHQYHHDNWITIWVPWCPVRKKESDWRSAWLIGPQSTFLHNSHESIIIDTLQSILVFGLEIERHNHPPFQKWIRGGWRYQNRWIFGKNPNGLWPPRATLAHEFGLPSKVALKNHFFEVGVGGWGVKGVPTTKIMHSPFSLGLCSPCFLTPSPSWPTPSSSPTTSISPTTSSSPGLKLGHTWLRSCSDTRTDNPSHTWEGENHLDLHPHHHHHHDHDHHHQHHHHHLTSPPYMVLGRGLQASRERRSMNHLLARNRLSAGRHIPGICIICISYWDCLYFYILLVICWLAGTYLVFVLFVFLLGFLYLARNWLAGRDILGIFVLYLFFCIICLFYILLPIGKVRARIWFADCCYLVIVFALVIISINIVIVWPSKS